MAAGITRLFRLVVSSSAPLAVILAVQARAVVEPRSGTAYEPRLAELAARNLADILAELDETRMWERALEIEPFPQTWTAGERIDAAFVHRSQVAVASRALDGCGRSSPRPPPGAWAYRQSL